MRTSGVIAEARVWAYGDYIDTDVLAPGLYMKSSMEVMASRSKGARDMPPEAPQWDAIDICSLTNNKQIIAFRLKVKGDV